MRTERRKWLAVFALFFTIALALLIVAFLHSTPNVHADGLEPDCAITSCMATPPPDAGNICETTCG